MDVKAYETLSELFPLVDWRIIKATVLEHGDDIGAAANYICEIQDSLNPPHINISESVHSSTDYSEIQSSLIHSDEIFHDSLGSEQLTQDISSPKGDLLMHFKDYQFGEEVQNSFTEQSVKDDDIDLERSFHLNSAIDSFVEEEALLQSMLSSASSIQAVDSERIQLCIDEAKADKQRLDELIQNVNLLRERANEAEAAAREAELEAERGGTELEAKFVEMRQMVVRARDANASHAGEVYGEKAVLATEARELCNRLSEVKVKKQNAEEMLDEITEALQQRIKLAECDALAAHEKRAAKENSVRQSLAAEEAELARIQEESREIECQAAECTKLREFLMDRGSVVDSLQGEIEVLCEDVELLKKRIEGSVELTSSSSSSWKEWQFLDLEKKDSSLRTEYSQDIISPHIFVDEC